MSKPLALAYGNCQADGWIKQLRKTAFAEHYDIKIWHNWRLILLEEEFTPEFIASLEQASLFIYQPTGEFKNVQGGTVPSTDYILENHIQRGCKTISVAYWFNSGFFPIIKVAPGLDGWITGSDVKYAAKNCPDRLLKKWDIEHFTTFDCIKRFAYCLAEQRTREVTTDVKLCDFILDHFQTQQLFLTQNHPTSAVFVEMARQVLRLINPAWDQEIPWSGVNEANLPGALALHPAVVRELGLIFDSQEGEMDQYRRWIEELIKETHESAI